MGNLSSLSIQGRQNPQDEEPTGPHKWPSMSVNWEDFQRRRVIDEDNPLSQLNGLMFSDIVVPETVMEVILSYVRPEDVLVCNLVCRNWKDIITRKSYWRKWFDRKGLDWNMVPTHVKEKREGWVVLWAEVLKHISAKNFVSNHSGEGGFDNWTRFRDGGNGWRVEQPPVGCDDLPDDPFFSDIGSTKINSAFATSFHWCSKWTMIDLWELGLTPPVMTTSLPFEIVCSQMYGSRFDCGGEFTWTLRILDTDEHPIMEHESKYNLHSHQNWETVEHAFKFKEEHSDKMDEVRYLVFMHDGKDNQFWQGHYGTKFARSCVRFRYREPESCTEGIGAIGEAEQK